MGGTASHRRPGNTETQKPRETGKPGSVTERRRPVLRSTDQAGCSVFGVSTSGEGAGVGDSVGVSLGVSLFSFGNFGNFGDFGDSVGVSFGNFGRWFDGLQAAKERDSEALSLVP